MADEKKRVTKGKVTVKKKTLTERFFKNLIEEDTKSITDYIIDELVIPGCMNTIHNIITGTADKIFGGNSRSSGGGNRVVVSNPIGGHFAYDKVGTTTKTSSKANKYDFKQFLFADRKDADDVKDQLVALIEGPYGKAKVADLYEFIGPVAEKYSDFTDHKYGWNINDVKGINVRWVSDGYIIELPAPHPL